MGVEKADDAQGYEEGVGWRHKADISKIYVHSRNSNLPDGLEKAMLGKYLPGHLVYNVHIPLTWYRWFAVPTFGTCTVRCRCTTYLQWASLMKRHTYVHNVRNKDAEAGIARASGKRHADDEVDYCFFSSLSQTPALLPVRQERKRTLIHEAFTIRNSAWAVGYASLEVGYLKVNVAIVAPQRLRQVLTFNVYEYVCTTYLLQMHTTRCVPKAVGGRDGDIRSNRTPLEVEVKTSEPSQVTQLPHRRASLKTGSGMAAATIVDTTFVPTGRHSASPRAHLTHLRCTFQLASRFPARNETRRLAAYFMAWPSRRCWGLACNVTQRYCTRMSRPSWDFDRESFFVKGQKRWDDPSQWRLSNPRRT
ncbi:hypothetical protein ACRALDRAFT_205024 [Sodiomyces alcalophilus JCM 7366]|uniref:uncharacterized protein n=1 Tax=Sodiomyces alcalophilus JCM 7366 TaxID=591952 RepID=UPI0039B4D482